MKTAVHLIFVSLKLVDVILKLNERSKQVRSDYALYV